MFLPHQLVRQTTTFLKHHLVMKIQVFFYILFPGVEWGHIEKSKFIKKVNREKRNFLTIL